MNIKFKFIKYKKINKNSILITLNRCKKKNALSDDMKIELIKFTEIVNNLSDIRVIILNSGKDFFSAGNDIFEKNNFGKNLTLADAREKVRLGPALIEAWSKLSAITICAINGGAIGGGMSLTLACDFRIIRKDTYFYAPEVKLGITLGWHTIKKLFLLIGMSRLKRIVILSEKVFFQDLLDWGLADELDEDPLELSLKWSERLLAIPENGQKMALESIKLLENLNTYDSYNEIDKVLLTLNYKDSKKYIKKYINTFKK